MKNFTFNKITITLGLMFTATVMLCSCKKLIEIPPNPPNQLPQEAVFADSTSTIGAMAGIYSYSLSEFGFTDGNLSKFTALSSDELSTSITSDPTIAQFGTNSLSTDNPYVAGFWTNLYAAIYKVNVCITGIENGKGISAGLKKQLLAELKVVRALYYFHMVNLFNGVPIVTSTDYHVTATLPRATVDQVYGQIIDDLLAAQKDLTAAYPSEGRKRPNLYVAKAFLAKVYLYRGQWNDAYNMANDVISQQQYQLEPDLNKVFLDGSTEAIWQLPATTLNSSQTNEALNFVPTVNNVIPGYFFTNQLKNAFEPGDQRFLNWVNSNSVELNGNTQSFYYSYKYKNLFAPFPTTEDFMIFRLADLYLIRAEASAQLGNLGGAQNDLFVVRNRAGLGKSTATSQADILNAIMHERQVELFCEWGNRWFDLKRTKTIDQVLTVAKPGWKPSAALFPIPYLEIRKNTNLIQNPNYN